MCDVGAKILEPQIPPISTSETNLEPVDRNVRLEKQWCSNCRNAKESCSRILLKSNSNKFVLRRLCAEQEEEQGLLSWDLARFKYPAHPDLKKSELVHIQYLSLHFESIEGE